MELSQSYWICIERVGLSSSRDIRLAIGGGAPRRFVKAEGVEESVGEGKAVCFLFWGNAEVEWGWYWHFYPAASAGAKWGAAVLSIL